MLYVQTEVASEKRCLWTVGTMLHTGSQFVALPRRILP